MKDIVSLIQYIRDPPTPQDWNFIHYWMSFSGNHTTHREHPHAMGIIYYLIYIFHRFIIV